MTEKLVRVYPQILFQSTDKPILIEINPAAQLHACLFDSTTPSARVGSQFIHHRMVVELFPAQCNDVKSVAEVCQRPLNPYEEKYADFSIFFKMRDDADPLSYLAHREILSSESPYFRIRMREGGLLARDGELGLVNQHCTPQAIKVVMDIFYGKESLADLSWQDAAHAAELVGHKDIFNMGPAHTEKLLRHMRSKFTVEEAYNMLTVAFTLKDKVALQEYEQTLMAYIGSPQYEQEIADLALSWQGELPNLFKAFSDYQTEKLIIQGLADAATNQLWA